MKLQTTVDLPNDDNHFSLADKFLFAGSCFSENIGAKFLQLKFDALVNPFGVLYNPMSVQLMLDMFMGARELKDEDLVMHNALWHSLLHHGSFSNASKDQLMENVNKALEAGKKQLKNANFLIITWGTAWIYQYVETQNIVANCHKIPAKEFERFRLSVSEVVAAYELLLSKLLLFNPKLKIILTVSPVRHLKDTAHGNQLSKSVLLLAAEQLVEKYAHVSYFPAYEIVLDELRDYRFYTEDMIHPNKVAVDFIWEKIEAHYINDATKTDLKTIEQIRRAAEHRPFNVETEAHQKFVLKTLEKIRQMEKKFPNLHFDTERNILQKQIL